MKTHIDKQGVEHQLRYGGHACWCSRCEQMFSNEGTFDLHIYRGRHYHPAKVPGGKSRRLVRNAKGIWVRPGSFQPKGNDRKAPRIPAEG